MLATFITECSWHYCHSWIWMTHFHPWILPTHFILEFWCAQFHAKILMTPLKALSCDDPFLSLNFDDLIFILEIFILAFFWPHFHPYIISNPIIMLEFWWVCIHPRILMTPLSRFNFNVYDATFILEFWWPHFYLWFLMSTL